MKKSARIINSLYSGTLLLVLLLLWQGASMTGILPAFMVPAPTQVVQALVFDFDALKRNAGITLLEAAVGLGGGVFLGFFCAVAMDHWKTVYRALYPLVVLTQTVPTIAIAPLLVLWMGYGLAPKITLIIIVTFFPVAVALYEGFQSVDKDMLRLLRVMNATPMQTFLWVKWPAALPSFFASLRISTSYAVVGGVIAEWIGGDRGLGVYMTLARQSYAYDKMFAVIVFISLLSLGLMAAVRLLQGRMMPWEVKDDKI